MADVGTDHGGERGDMDVRAHVSTYGSVINLFFYGAIACAAIAFLVIWIIS